MLEMNRMIWCCARGIDKAPSRWAANGHRRMKAQWQATATLTREQHRQQFLSTYLACGHQLFAALLVLLGTYPFPCAGEVAMARTEMLDCIEGCHHQQQSQLEDLLLFGKLVPLTGTLSLLQAIAVSAWHVSDHLRYHAAGSICKVVLHV
mmetsp:Transcript_36777/g.84695  ORF Transcript_36777/g.84695 Transcript_36777/m.84695 type:complete len:150 (-) Transcript_36777:46-495(-)